MKHVECENIDAFDLIEKYDHPQIRYFPRSTISLSDPNKIICIFMMFSIMVDSSDATANSREKHFFVDMSTAYITLS